MRQPIGLYLTEFAPDGPVAFPAEAPGLPGFDADTFDIGPDLALMEPEALAPAFDLEPLPTPEPDVAAMVEALQAEHAAALAAARDRWVVDESAALAEGLAAAIVELETRVAAVLAPLLEPFLVRAVQLDTIARLRTALASLFASNLETAIAVSGPADLLDALRPAFADRPGLTFTASEAPDVTVVAGDAQIRSRLADWARALEATLGDATPGEAA